MTTELKQLSQLNTNLTPAILDEDSPPMSSTSSEIEIHSLREKKNMDTQNCNNQLRLINEIRILFITLIFHL